MDVNIISAVSSNFCIGKDNKLCWHIPNDLKKFKELTKGHVVIMGRKTFESIGKPLPDRVNVILSKKINPKIPPTCFVASSIEEALNTFKDKKIFVIGGEKAYKATEPYATTIYLTRVTMLVKGDAYFPREILNNFNLTKTEPIEDSTHEVRLETYTRREA